MSQVRDASTKKQDPFPQFGNPTFVKKFHGLFVMYFRTLRTFLVFTKIFTIKVVFWLVKVGMGDTPSPPLVGKFPLYLVFFLLFTE